MNIYGFMCKIHTNIEEACIMKEKVLDKSLQCSTYLQTYTQISLANDKYSYQTRTNQKRYWNMVKIGHWDLILTTSLYASGRVQTKGKIRPNVIRKSMYEGI